MPYGRPSQDDSAVHYLAPSSPYIPKMFPAKPTGHYVGWASRRTLGQSILDKNEPVAVHAGEYAAELIDGLIYFWLNFNPDDPNGSVIVRIRPSDPKCTIRKTTLHPDLSDTPPSMIDYASAIVDALDSNSEPIDPAVKEKVVDLARQWAYEYKGPFA